MPGTVQDLAQQLLTAIDPEGNVLNIQVVNDVVGQLEQTTVTTEELKMTRLGNHINKVRKHDQQLSKELARRMKQLIKQWRLLLPRAPSNGLGAAGGAGNISVAVTLEQDSTSQEPAANVSLQPPPVSTATIQPPPSVSISPPPAPSVSLPPLSSSSTIVPPPSSALARPPPPDRTKSRNQLMHRFSQVKKPQTTSTQPQASLPTNTNMQPSKQSSSTAQTDVTVTTTQHTQVVPTPTAVCESQQHTQHSTLSTSIVPTTSQTFQLHKPFDSPAFDLPACHPNVDLDNLPTNLTNEEMPSVTELQRMPLNSQEKTCSLYWSLQVSLPIQYYAQAPLDHSNTQVLHQINLQPTKQDSNTSDHRSSISCEPAINLGASGQPPSRPESNALLSSTHQTAPSLNLSTLPRPLHDDDQPVESRTSLKLAEPTDVCASGSAGPLLVPGAQDKYNDVNSLIVQIPRKTIKLSNFESAQTGVESPLSLVVSIHTAVLQRAPSLIARRRKNKKIKRSSTSNNSIESTGIVSNSTEISDSLFNSKIGPAKENFLFCLPHEPRQKPPNFIQGLDGCFGRDGFWYDWTEPIFSQQHIMTDELAISDGVPVTVLPYVYIDTDWEGAVGIADQSVS